MSVDVDVAREEAEDFLYEEAGLLDRRDYEAWLALFEPDGMYWLPSNEATVDPNSHVSIVYDDVARLRGRIHRLLSGKAYAQAPPSRICHIVGNVRVQPAGDHEVAVRSNYAVLETRLDREKHIFFGPCTHRLRRTPEGLRIVEKQLWLLDNDQFMREIPFIL